MQTGAGRRRGEEGGDCLVWATLSGGDVHVMLVAGVKWSLRDGKAAMDADHGVAHQVVASSYNFRATSQRTASHRRGGTASTELATVVPLCPAKVEARTVYVAVFFYLGERWREGSGPFYMMIAFRLFLLQVRSSTHAASLNLCFACRCRGPWSNCLTPVLVDG